MSSLEKKLKINGTLRRSIYLFFQLGVLYLVAVYSLLLGTFGLPIVALALFSAVYVTLKQVEGVVEDKLDR
jgi:hypothetical protein